MLKKRHSTYVLSPPLDQPKTPVPVPGPPPKRPLRNPARPGVVMPGAGPKPKAKSRPSTATGTREEITPWEFEPGPANDEPPTTPLSSRSSPVSTKVRASLTTGPVAEVTPWELYPVTRSATSRSSLTTGMIEEVTPWELQPVPSAVPNRSTLATGPMEEVTPWELAPAPVVTESIPQKRSSPRASTSSGQGKTLAEIAHLRRRKSTSSKASKSRSNTIPVASSQSSGPQIAPGSGPIANHAVDNSSKHESAPPSRSAPTTPRLSHKTSGRPIVPALASLPTPVTSEQPSEQPSMSPRTGLKFSTADRTILEELKRNIKARESQFVLKGAGTALASGLGSYGKRHHAFPKDEVPYPRNYEREVMDLDVWETAFCQDICESLTWHVFETPPTNVLDLGCGSGTWILNCARVWKDSHFVGLDVVPLQPDLQQVGSSDLASRITWVHSNFLEGLPFPDEEFDFVHIKRIALGVPEDKWDFIFEEITRVMKPGGAFEMLEEDLFFPGKLIDSDSESEPESDSEQPMSALSSHGESAHSHSNSNLESLAESVPPLASSYTSNDASPPTPTTTAFPTTPSRSNSPVGQVAINEDTEKAEAQDFLAQVIGDYPIPSKQPIDDDAAVHEAVLPPAVRPELHAKPHKPRSLAAQPLGSLFAGSAVSLIVSSMGSVPPPDSMLEKSASPKPRTRARGYSMSASVSIPDSNSQPVQGNSPVSPVGGSRSVPPVPLLLRTIAKPPANPRDHSLLEAIYVRLLESRFINISPLALLTNSIGLHFKDVRTHPPLQYRFPAVSRKVARPSRDVAKNGANYDSEDPASDSDDARDAILPSPVPRSAKRKSRRVSSQDFEEPVVPISDDNRYIGLRGIIKHSSPYITLDESRSSALSPSVKTGFPSLTSAKSKRGPTLPNTTMHLDLKTLNLHLALRVAEILACSESMWEWVQQYQAEAAAQKAARVRPFRSGTETNEMAPRKSIASASSRDSSDSMRNSILDLTRDDFDGLLSKFEMDMRDKCALGPALEERFSWSVVESQASSERKIFETACEKWDKWELEQLAAAATPSEISPSHTGNHRHPLSGAHATPHPSPATLHFTETHDQGHGRHIAQTNKKRRLSTSSGSTLLPPTRRMSRAVRVFVAWKA
ncbi:hypothetical protein LshimejAT787_0502410 [Lyophyllum shimeji]|uniref:Methyltransferase domain-containing protein n=1 Tax=Lyophyllum shimeji TaxID=47721 RepID=A0A9P3PMG5_LYOSH|nr:hypothetical protein LshimejAT787_0502410 [Lyophyllum shimeji]